MRQLLPDVCTAAKWNRYLKYGHLAEKVHFPILVLHFTEERFWVLEAWSVQAGPRFCAAYLVQTPMMGGDPFPGKEAAMPCF